MPDQTGVSISKSSKACIDLPGSASLSNLVVEFALIHPAQGHLRAVVEKNVHRKDIVNSLPCHLSVHAAGIVAEHSTEGAMVVRRRIGPPSQSVLRRRIA